MQETVVQQWKRNAAPCKKPKTRRSIKHKQKVPGPIQKSLERTNRLSKSRILKEKEKRLNKFYAENLHWQINELCNDNKRVKASIGSLEAQIDKVISETIDYKEAIDDITGACDRLNEEINALMHDRYEFSLTEDNTGGVVELTQ